jgi:hypothetical protein
MNLEDKRSQTQQLTAVNPGLRIISRAKKTAADSNFEPLFDLFPS